MTVKLTSRHIGQILRGTYNGKPRQAKIVNFKEHGADTLAICETGEILPDGKPEIKSFYLGKVENLTISPVEVPNGWDHL